MQTESVLHHYTTHWSVYAPVPSRRGESQNTAGEHTEEHSNVVPDRGYLLCCLELFVFISVGVTNLQMIPRLPSHRTITEAW